MKPTKEQLKEVDCLFVVDRVSGDPAMTAFKEEARYRQHLWAVNDRQIVEFGSHPGRKDSEGVRQREPNGTKLLDADAEAGKNFLSETIHQAVEDRIKNNQQSETLDKVRLRRDLLSSMPMAFNLFGEAAQHDASKQALAELFAPGADGPVEIIFEWSPERRSDKYTRDRTAFDVALRIGDLSGPQTVVGIETKYHEHSEREKKPKAVAVQRYEKQTAFLVDIAQRSGVFWDGWEDAVLPSDLRQIWRDHLLALSMRKHLDKWTEVIRYVLIYPSRNSSFAKAAQRYASLLKPGGNSFAAHTIEEIVGAAFAHGGSTEQQFRDRYLW